MVTGGGRITYAHVEQIIDFETIEGVREYVRRNEQRNRTIYYLNKGDYPSRTFEESRHVQVIDGKFSIKVWLPYNGLSMGV